MQMKEYRGDKRNEISFPIGGIGSGCIGLGGDGRFREWEIFNRPNKNTLLGFSHLAIRAEADGRVVDARVLNTDLKAPFTGEVSSEIYRGFGHGPYRQTMAGIPHFEDGVFRAAYPLAELAFADRRFPGQITLSAFNPLIPLQEDDSSIPAGFFEITIANDQPRDLDYAVAFSLCSPFPQGSDRREVITEDGRTYLLITREDCAADSPDYGEMCIATDAAEKSFQQYWYRGAWYDNLAVFWKNFTTPGKLQDRVYTAPVPGANLSERDTSTLAAHIRVAAGETRRVRFLVSWYFPNCTYHPDPNRRDAQGRNQWRNYYAVLYPGAKAAAEDALRRWDALHADTLRFVRAFYDQTLPPVMLDAAGSNISILKSPTVLRLENGAFYGWEGVHSHEGSCEGSCTHVWNYAYALPFLFPRLERSMRSLHFQYDQDEAGGLRFRTQLPLGAPRWSFRPCCDGQFGDVIKVYREWKLSGDDAWLRSLWEGIKRGIAYAWSAENPDRWDHDRDGVLEGRQHHTLDMELFGPNSWLTSMYLAALKAAAEMAEHLGETELAAQYRELFAKGSKKVDATLFNGEYYEQAIDLTDKGILEKYADASRTIAGGDTLASYWNDEAKEIKYQFGQGCVADQVLGCWHSAMCGLGDILDPEHVSSALHAIYRYNYKDDLRLHINPCRIYAMADERTTLICEWPEGKYKPVIPAPYTEEGWPGIEYQLAAHMQSNGMYDEALTIVRAVRDRYDGFRRNPFNEIECGSNYARSMASYALLIAVSGFCFDLTQGMIGFVPHDPAEDRRYFFSVDTAWGTFAQKGDARTLSLEKGTLTLRSFRSDRPIHQVLLNGEPIPAAADGNSIVLSAPLPLKAGDKLTLN